VSFLIIAPVSVLLFVIGFIWAGVRFLLCLFPDSPTLLWFCEC